MSPTDFHRDSIPLFGAVTFCVWQKMRGLKTTQKKMMPKMMKLSEIKATPKWTGPKNEEDPKIRYTKWRQLKKWRQPKNKDIKKIEDSTKNEIDPKISAAPKMKKTQKMKPLP